MNTSVVQVVATAIATLVVTGLSADSEAFTMRRPATAACRASYPDEVVYEEGGQIVIAELGSSVQCWVENTSDNPVSNYSGVAVYVKNNSGFDNMGALACSVSPSSGASACGTSDTTTGTGFQALQPGVSEWSDVRDYAFVYVYGPGIGAQGYDFGRVLGIRVF